LNTYGYVGGNPGNLIDPYGLTGTVWGTRIAGGAICLAPIPGARVLGVGIIAATMVTGDTPTVTQDKAGLKVSPIAERLTPPGNCGEKQQKNLQNEVNNSCKRPRSCRNSMSTDQLLDRMENNRACATARDRINKICFSGGDKGHRDAAIDAWSSVVSCEKALLPK